MADATFDPGAFLDVTSNETMARLHEEASAPPQAVETPWPTWNRACRDEGGSRGPALGWQVVVAGMTGQGKSLIALNWAAEAVRRGENVVFFTGEMSPQQLWTRFLAISTRTPIRDLERGDSFNPFARKGAEKSIATLRGQGGGALFINRTSVAGVRSIGDAMQWFHEGEHKVRVFFFDYIQLFASGATDDSFFRDVTEISRAVQRFAHERRSLCVELSQFSRGQDVKERPTIFKLKHSSNLEQDADQVVLIDHAMQTYNKDTAERFQWLLLAKNRHGPQVNVPVIWNYRTLTCRELLIDQGDSIPEWVPDKVRNAA